MVLPRSNGPSSSKKQCFSLSTEYTSNSTSTKMDETAPNLNDENGTAKISEGLVGNAMVALLNSTATDVVDGEDGEELPPEFKELAEVEKVVAEENAHETKPIAAAVIDRSRTFKMLQMLLEQSGIYAELILKRIKEEEELEKTARSKMGKSKDNGSENGFGQKSNERRRGQAARQSSGMKYADYFDQKELKVKKAKYAVESVPDLKTVKQHAGAGQDQSSSGRGSLATPFLFTGGELRPYQIDGLQWLKAQYEYGINGILGDEMGLGKTVQCIAMISYLYGEGVPGPFLIVGPLSTLPNWSMEFERFTPQIPVVLYHGSLEKRSQLRKDIKAEWIAPWNGKKIFPVVLTSYEIIMRDCKFLSHFSWKHMIIDEAQRVKNFRCRMLRKLKTFKVDSRLLLTGTPIQNNLAELWSLLNFMLPDVFANLEWFEELFGVETVHQGTSFGSAVANLAKQEEENQMITKLHRILAPFLLRRLKRDVELDLPKKKEIIVYAPMTPLQMEYYKAGVEKTIVSLFREDKSLNHKARSDDAKLRSSQKDNNEICSRNGGPVKQNLNCVRNTMMLFRKITMHPYLLENPLVPGTTSEFLIDENLVLQSGKMLVLDRLLLALKRRGHKILLFSTMTQMLDILMDYCQYRTFKFCRLDGTMSLEDRQCEIQRFNTEPEYFLFLISTRAGGLGLNLMAADTVIIFDSDWNPQVDLQAQDRCHRIGQTKPVIVYRFVARGTIDDRIIECATAKRRLEKMVIYSGKFKQLTQEEFTGAIPALTAAELKELLKTTDYNEYWDTTSRGKEVLSDEDLEKLLDRESMI